MTTYIDWKGELNSALLNTPTQTYRAFLALASRNFKTCAISNQSPLIPLYIDFAPKDDKLYNYASDFAEAVIVENYAEAKKILYLIEQRSKVIVRRVKKLSKAI